jgi:Questin oxidase-like
MGSSSPTQTARENVSTVQPPAEKRRLGPLAELRSEPLNKALLCGDKDASRQAVVDALLNDQTYHIEFNGGLSNHNKHAVIALNGLDAPAERIKSYYDTYAALTPYGYPLEPPKASKHVITSEDWELYLGKRASFSSYCQFFDQQERELGMEQMLRRYIPTVVPGWVGALTHATIHLGWALDAGHRWMTIEGLAYMVFSYVSCSSQRTFPATRDASAEKSVSDSILRIAVSGQEELDALRNWVKKVVAEERYSVAGGFRPELARTELQHKIAAILAEGHPLIHATPAWIDDQDLTSIWGQMYYAVTLLYMSRPGDFVILHLITSLYGMEQIANRMPPEQQKSAIQCFWRGMIGILLGHGEIPTRSALEALNAKYTDAIDVDGKPSEGPDWEQIIARAIAEAEEHNPKLVYVQQKLWKRYGYRTVFRIAAAHFTVTPKLPTIFEEPPVE